MYFYNPPYIFWGAWNTLSPLLPEPTRQKIQVIDPAQNQALLDAIDASVSHQLCADDMASRGCVRVLSCLGGGMGAGGMGAASAPSQLQCSPDVGRNSIVQRMHL